MISIAVHIVFAWVLGLTMQAQTVEELPAEKPAIIEELKKEDVAPVAPAQPETPQPASEPVL